jgi:hypothetical protein
MWKTRRASKSGGHVDYRNPVNCSSSVSKSARPAWASIWSVPGGHRSQSWRSFLDNHLKSLVSVDFFTVPTIRFQVLYAFSLES